ncbi:Glycosyltransferase involved in cell wall bisynthesis [Gillisia sp. Hel1_33_143]|uniref:glycosyltransferase family 2 protein n=1 Tax=Gillisia sp. Hel1_33_143 TaxID=1336796 RepID=UPI000879884D|nr:glycosyltransferase family A protein [Gillisia sp. Hel1_33_143]SDS79327.1 Glycosyltransferase involved in cell wall bisynthesis [Gillisia sp. Hel1_33_143]
MNLDTHLISIIIPTFNRSNTIRRAIESVLNQTSSIWELIIVDDGSIDNTREVIESYIRNPKVSYFYQKNKGTSAARNFGALQAKGEFLIFLDSDDFVFSELIGEIQKLNLNSLDLISWEVLKTWDGDQKIWKPKRLDSMYNHVKANFLAGSVAYRKSLFFEVGGFDANIKFGENYELGLRISKYKGLKLEIINKPLSGYLLDSTKRTSDSPINKLISYFHQYRKHRLIYISNSKQHAQLLYMIGYNLEKLNKKNSALKVYVRAWKTYPYKLKALLKIIYLKMS